MPPYSFPILSTKEVAVVLSNLEIANVSEEILAAPTPDLAFFIYSSILNHIDPLGLSISLSPHHLLSLRSFCVLARFRLNLTQTICYRSRQLVSFTN